MVWSGDMFFVPLGIGHTNSSPRASVCVSIYSILVLICKLISSLGISICKSQPLVLSTVELSSWFENGMSYLFP